MKVVNSGDNIFSIYNDAMRVYEGLPPAVYSVQLSERSGFFLEKEEDFEIKERKIYGEHMKKVEKIMRSFGKFNRNLGVILSGDKGIGKTMFSTVLANECVKSGIPVIVVNKYNNGIASYIDDIQQNVMVLFDEFEKTFSKGNDDDDDEKNNPQVEMLSLFDGLSSGKKLFVVTCNDIYDLSRYIINRPGRFHYHIRFDYPTYDEVKKYLYDNIDEKYRDQIDAVADFSNKTNLSYDCLRSIAFEINSGESFKDAIGDLNIMNIEDEHYDIIVSFDNGLEMKAKNVSIDFFDYDDTDGCPYAYFYGIGGYPECRIDVNCVHAEYDPMRQAYFVNGDNIRVREKSIDRDPEDLLLNGVPTGAIMKRSKSAEYHYAL